MEIGLGKVGMSKARCDIGFSPAGPMFDRYKFGVFGGFQRGAGVCFALKRRFDHRDAVALGDLNASGAVLAWRRLQWGQTVVFGHLETGGHKRDLF